MKIGLGIGIPKRQSSSGGGSSFDNDYQALLDAASGDLPTESTQTAQNTLVLDLKAAGVWDKLDLFYVFATDGGDDIRRRNWITPASFQATAVNSPTFTSLEGFTFDGATSYLNTNWSPSDGVNFTLTAASFGAYSRSNPVGSGGKYIGSQNGIDSRNFINPRNGAGNFTGFVNGNGATFINTAVSDSLGLTSMNRVNATTAQGYKNGVLLDTKTITNDLTVDTLDFYIGVDNNSGSPSDYWAGQISIAFTGGNLSSEMSDFFTAIDKYMTAIGKNV